MPSEIAARRAVIAAPVSRRPPVPWIVPPLLVLAALFFYPLALIVGRGLIGPRGLTVANYAAVLSSEEFYDALLHTVEIACAATAGCLVLGFVLALLLAFVPFPGARLAGRLIDTFIALPTFLVGLAFTFIYGTAGLLNGALVQGLDLSSPPLDFLYSPAGVIMAEVTVYTPFVLRPVLAAFSLIEAAQIEVASSLGARAIRIVTHIILPAALPALLAGGSLCLLLTVNEFGIVFFIGAKGVITLPLLVYDKAIQEFDYTSACVIATINVALSLALFMLYRLVLSRLGGTRAGLV
jgi:2-aminoethylphosphonate transport system permease protein